MQFNIKKCKVLGMGKNNENRDYIMQGAILEHVTQAKDLEVVIDTGNKRTGQCQVAIGKANGVLGCIRRRLNYKSTEVILTLYRNPVKPHLQYCVQFGSLLYILGQCLKVKKMRVQTVLRQESVREW